MSASARRHANVPGHHANAAGPHAHAIGPHAHAAPTSQARQPYLGILAMARNECPSFKEWLAHHRAQGAMLLRANDPDMHAGPCSVKRACTAGVDHFFIIDNDSDDIDATCRAELNHPDVTVWHWMTRARPLPLAPSSPTVGRALSSRLHPAATALNGTATNRTLSNQARAYNAFLPFVTTEWVAIWDIDE